MNIGVANVGAAGAVAAVLLGVAVLLWPRRASARSPIAGLRPVDVLQAGSGPAPGARGDVDPDNATSSLWQQDPVDLYRQWRLRRRPGDLVDDVLDLLRGIGPALGAGLTPARAIELAATSTLGAERVSLARESTRRQGRRGDRNRVDPSAARADIDRLVGALLDASDRAEPTSPVWAAWADRSASTELALVAAAWRLSETTGAPLASAVDRAVRGLLDARARRSKVAVAVAGPRATVTVLTLLPLTGPLFGLACGIDPATLYLGSPVATACAGLGLVLVWAGRVWCTRMVRRAVRP